METRVGRVVAGGGVHHEGSFKVPSRGGYGTAPAAMGRKEEWEDLDVKADERVTMSLATLMMMDVLALATGPVCEYMLRRRRRR
eukprot:754987-Hanusia_phi.AAC.1